MCLFNISDQPQYDVITDKLQYKQQELKYSIFITENCLYLLWAHLDFFMLRAISVNYLQQNGNLLNDCKLSAILSQLINDLTFVFLHLIFQYLAIISSPIDAGWKVASNDVGILKKNLITVFNETFCKQLISTTQDQTSTDKSFVEALLRRIKRLIQFVPVSTN